MHILYPQMLGLLLVSILFLLLVNNLVLTVVVVVQLLNDYYCTACLGAVCIRAGLRFLLVRHLLRSHLISYGGMLAGVGLHVLDCSGSEGLPRGSC